MGIIRAAIQRSPISRLLAVQCLKKQTTVGVSFKFEGPERLTRKDGDKSP